MILVGLITYTDCLLIISQEHDLKAFLKHTLNFKKGSVIECSVRDIQEIFIYGKRTNTRRFCRPHRISVEDSYLLKQCFKYINNFLIISHILKLEHDRRLLPSTVATLLSF